MLARPRLGPLRARAIVRSAPLLRPSSPSSPSPPHHHIRKASTAAAAAATTTTKRKVIFSGIQPTGVPHLGNYLGALKQWVHLQNTAAPTTTTLLYSVVDLHAITSPAAAQTTLSSEEETAQHGKALRDKRRETLAALLAVGLDPERSILFYQSACSAHAELMWILSCTASMGYLSRMTQWKSKLSLSLESDALDEETKAKLKLGLFSYPVLQAADIMVHGATHVPVGDDQKQHLEFTRECAKNFNSTYRTSLLVPPETILSPARRVMSLQQPTSKMSKSDPNPKSRIDITDSAATITKKIQRALTDTESSHITYDPATRPGVANLLEILSILTNQTPEDLVKTEGFDSEDVPLKALKMRTAEAVVKELGEVRERYLYYTQQKGAQWLDDVAQKGAEKANANAERTMKLVREAIGL